MVTRGADWRDELAAIVPPSAAGYSERFPETLLDTLMHVGDPVVDRAIATLHEDSYRGGAGNLDALSERATAGEPDAVAFFDHAESVPSWVDWDVIARGQRLALAHFELYGLSLLHDLFAGAVFTRAAQVTGATGRLGSDPARRIQETAGFVAAVLADDGARPGSPGHATATRVRLLHGSIRVWFLDGFDHDTPYTGAPIDQVMLAMTLGLFSHQTIRNLLRMGVPLERADVEGHHLLWRYLGHLLGIDDRLLTETPEQEAELWAAIVAHQAFPELIGPDGVDRLVEMMAGQMPIPVGAERRERFTRTVFDHLSGPEILGVDDLGGHALHRFVLRSMGRSLGATRRWVPGADRRLTDRGRRRIDASLELGHEHDYGVTIASPIDEEAQRARYEHGLRVVADRFTRPDRGPTTIR